MFNYHGYQVLLACGATDMRKATNGLCEIVQYNFSLNPFEKTIFVFCNKQRNRIKMLVWEENGFWIHFKRLEKGHVTWPDVVEDEATMSFSIVEFENLLKAPGIAQKVKRQAVIGS